MSPFPTAPRAYVRHVFRPVLWISSGVMLLCLLGSGSFLHAQSTKSEQAQQKQEAAGERPPFSKVRTLLPSAVLREGQTNARWKKIIESSPYSVIYKRPFSAGETVFVGVQRKANESTLTPVVGWDVPDSFEGENAWALFGVVPPPFIDPGKELSKNTVRFYLYDVTESEKHVSPHGIEWTWQPGDNPKKKLDFFSPRLSRAPVRASDTRVYTLPFAGDEGKTYSLVIAVTEDREQLKEILDVRETTGFNWNDWFDQIK